MRILVVGAGATGGFFGGLLARAGRDVTFLVRPARAEALRVNGLSITGPGVDWTIKPDTVTPAELAAGQGNRYDVVLLSVKAYSLDEAISDFEPGVGPHTVVIPGLNGLAHLDVLDEHFGRHRVLGGVMYVSTTLDEQGRIVELDDRLHTLAWGERDAAGAGPATALEKEFGDAGFTAAHSPHIEQAMWEKWVNLASLGAVTCLMRGTVGDVASSYGGIAYAEGVIDECVAVAAAHGFAVRTHVVDLLRATLTDPASTLTSSMYRDLILGRPTEGDHIVGDLIARAQSRDVAVPLLDTAYTALSVYQRRLTR
jgi:2-dehydropantoate 2-reductase